MPASTASESSCAVCSGPLIDCFHLHPLLMRIRREIWRPWRSALTRYRRRCSFNQVEPTRYPVQQLLWFCVFAFEAVRLRFVTGLSRLESQALLCQCQCPIYTAAITYHPQHIMAKNPSRSNPVFQSRLSIPYNVRRPSISQLTPVFSLSTVRQIRTSF